MLHHLEEYGRYVEISGFRGVKSETAETYLKRHRTQKQAVDVQFFDADLIASPQHLYFAALNALQAFKGKTNISKTAAIETILYASAQRQIQKAIQHSGLNPSTKNLAVLLIGEDRRRVEAELAAICVCVGKTPDESVLDLDEDKVGKIRRAFGITDQELETVKEGRGEFSAVTQLVIERVALLATQL